MKEKTLSKRGQISLEGLQVAALTFIILVLVIGVGALVVTNMQTIVIIQGGAGNVSTNATTGDLGRAAYNLTWNVTQSGLQGFVNMGQQTPLIALIIVMVSIIGLVVVAFGFGMQGGGFA
jgi:uncharacterized protein (UPF0333 family)